MVINITETVFLLVVNDASLSPSQLFNGQAAGNGASTDHNQVASQNAGKHLQDMLNEKEKTKLQLPFSIKMLIFFSH